MAAIPTFSFSILAKNMTGGVFAQLRNSLDGLKFGGQKVGEGMAGAATQTEGLVGQLFKAKLITDTWDYGIRKVNESIGFVKKGFSEATDLQNKAIIAATTFSALTGANYDQASEAIERLNNRLAKSAAVLPGSTQDYKQLATSINDNLIEAFKDADGKLDVKQWEDATASISESFGAITASSTKMVGNTSLGLTKALGGASVAQLRTIALFEQNPVLLNELEKKLSERNAKTLGDLKLADRISLLQEIGEKFISDDFKSAATESVDGLMQSYKSVLFDPSSGIFGLMRDLEESATGTQSVFTAYNETVKMFIGAESLWSNFSEIFQKLGLAIDPMKLLKSGFDFFNNALRVVVKILSGINKTIAPIEAGAKAIQGGLEDLVKLPQTLTSGLKGLDLGRILTIITSNIGRFIEPWVSKNLGIVADAVASGDSYQIDYQGYFKKIGKVLFERAGGWLVQFGDRLGSVVVSVLDVAAKVFYNTADLIIAKAPKIGEFVGNIAGSVVVTLGNLMSGFSTWIADQLPRFLATVRKGILAIGEFIQKLDFADVVVRFVKSILPGVNTGLQSLVSTGIPGIVNVFSSAVSVATDVVGEVGKAIVSGLWTFVTGINWGGLVLAVGKGLIKLDWGSAIVAGGKAYVTLLALGLAKSAALGVLGVTSTFLLNLSLGLSSALMGGLAGLFAPVTIAVGNFGAGLASAALGGLASTLAPLSTFFAGLSSAIAGGLASASTALMASAGLLIAPAALLLGAVAALAGAFLILSGGDIKNFRYAAEGWKTEMRSLTGVEINGVGDAIAASILGLGDGIGSIAGMIGSYFTLAKSEIHLSLQRTMAAIASFGNAISSLPGRAANAAKITGGAISKLPGKAALAAQTVTKDIGPGLSQTKSDIEGASGVELNSVGNAVGVVVFQYAKLLPQLVGGVFGAIGSGLRLVRAQIQLAVSQFLRGPAWKNWVEGWQSLGVRISGIPGAILGTVESWWIDWVEGWELLGASVVSGVYSLHATAVSRVEQIKSGFSTAWQFILGIPSTLREMARSANSAIAKEAKSLSDSFLSSIASIAGWWKGLWGKIWGAIEPFGKIAAGDASNLRQAWAIISDALRGIPDAIKELIEKVKEAVKGFIPNTIAGVGNAVATAAAPITQPVKEAASSIASTAGSIMDAATTVIKNVISGGKKDEKEEAPEPITIPAMFSGHIPHFDGGNPGFIPALLKSINLERANMPSGAQVAIANTSEWILKPDQMQGLVSGLIGRITSSMQPTEATPQRKSILPSLTQAASPIIKNFMPGLGGIVDAISGVMSGGQPALPAIAQAASPIIKNFMPGLGGIVDAISGLFGGEQSPESHPGITVPTFNTSPIGPMSSDPDSPFVGPVSSSTQQTQNESRIINLGPITIQVSAAVGMDPEQQAREVLRYIDLFLQEEMGATL
jgi:hypothetical protein